MKQITLFKLLFPFLLLTLCGASTLKEAVEHALANNPEVLSIQKNSQAYKLYVDEEKAGYYPTIDLDMFVENKNELKDPQDSSKTTTEKEGYNAKINLEQIIYDGGLTSSKVDEAKYNYQKTKIENIDTIENIIFETVQAYLNSVKYEELLILSRNNIAIHNSYLDIAKESEDVSGETLDRIQVESKLYLATSKLFQQINDNEVSQNSFYKLVGYNPKGFICRPNIKTELIPPDVKNAVDFSVKNSYSILGQIEEIKVQRAILSQEKSRFLPTLKFQLSEEYDNDLDTENSKSTSTSAKILMSYNLFNGYRDSTTDQRERIFLQESQKKLDDTRNIVVEDIKSSYSDYLNSKEKINYLKLYVAKNKEILAVYKEQFSGGTRTFIDILNSEAELFNAKAQLIEEEYSLLNSYYEILLILSKLSDTIVLQDKQVCTEMIVDLDPKPLDNLKTKDSDSDLSELEGLLDDDTGTEITNLEDETKNENKKEQVIQDLVADILNDIYELNKNKSEEDEVKKVKKLPKKEIKIEKVKENLKEKIIEDTNETNAEILGNDTNITVEKNQTNKSFLKPIVIVKDTRIFKERFLDADENTYTISLKTFKSKKEANEFISSHTVLSDAFTFRFGTNLEFIKTINGIYENYADAVTALTEINKEIKTSVFIIDYVRNQKELYSKYNINYEIEDTTKSRIKNEIAQQEVKIIEEVESTVEHEKIINKKDLEYSFFNANENDFTLSISTFKNIKELNDFVKQNNLLDKSFAFRFNDNHKLIKLIYGVYNSHDTAKKDFNRINTIVNTNVIIQKISDVKKLYGVDNIIKDETFKKKIKNNVSDVIKEDQKREKNSISNSKLNVIEDKKKFTEETIEESIEKLSKVENSEKQFKTTEEETDLRKTIIEQMGGIKELVQKDNVAELIDNKEQKTKSKMISDKQITTDKQMKSDVIKNEQQQIRKLRKDIIKRMQRIKFFANKSRNDISLPQEFVTPDSKKYTIMLLDFKNIEEATSYALRYKLDKNTIVFGFKDKYKLIHGAYETYEEATAVINNFDHFVKRTKPYVRKIYGYQSLYNKYNSNSNIDDVYKKLKNVKLENKNIEEKKDDIIIKEQTIVEEIPIIEIKSVPLEKIDKPKVNKSKLQNIKFLESKSNNKINLSNEFVSSKSKKYTIMILDFKNINAASQYAKQYNLNKNSIIFGYQDKYKLIYDAFNSYSEASKAILKLDNFVKKTKPYVRKISGYQDLYKKYNNNLKSNPEIQSKITFPNVIFKNEFLNKNSKKYTITLTTSPNFEEARWFKSKYKINNDTMVYKFGNGVKIIFGIFDSALEANKAIETLDYELQKLKPFVNRLRTHQKFYKKYNKRIED